MLLPSVKNTGPEPSQQSHAWISLHGVTCFHLFFYYFAGMLRSIASVDKNLSTAVLWVCHIGRPLSLTEGNKGLSWHLRLNPSANIFYRKVVPEPGWVDKGGEGCSEWRRGLVTGQSRQVSEEIKMPTEAGLACSRYPSSVWAPAPHREALENHSEEHRVGDHTVPEPAQQASPQLTHSGALPSGFSLTPGWGWW